MADPRSDLDALRALDAAALLVEELADSNLSREGHARARMVAAHLHNARESLARVAALVAQQGAVVEALPRCEQSDHKQPECRRAATCSTGIFDFCDEHRPRGHVGILEHPWATALRALDAPAATPADPWPARVREAMRILRDAPRCRATPAATPDYNHCIEPVGHAPETEHSDGDRWRWRDPAAPLVGAGSKETP